MFSLRPSVKIFTILGVTTVLNLNDIDTLRAVDKHAMINNIDALPGQLEAAWTMARDLPLPAAYRRVERIVIAAVGDAALCGDLLVAAVADLCNLPILIHRSYDLPAYVDGQATLVIAISHSGDTDEVLSAATLADARGVKLLAITGNGQGSLARNVETAGGAVWAYDDVAPERAALGWMFGLLIGLITRLGLVRDLSADMAEATQLLKRYADILTITSPVVKNPAKRLAGQFIGRTPLIYGAGITVPVARRWKMQLNLNAKSLAQWEELPEINHNALSGMNFPTPLMTKVAIVFLVAERVDHPQVARRWSLLRTMYLEHGFAPDTLTTRGSSVLAQMLSALHFGDYVSYYAAMCYQVDPTETPSIADLQHRLADG